jgi:hypothetical protein
MIQILAIVAYSFDGRIRKLDIRPGEANIVSGDSRTGKSATMDIVNYCFGSKEINVPEGKIRRNVSWFGLRLQTKQGQAFVARKVPLGDAKSSEAVYFHTGQVVSVPDPHELRPLTNRDGLRSLLATWTGISDYLHEPPTGQRRDPLVASIRHALAFCLQTQNEIAQKGHLFHHSSDRDVAQALKDTLPFFLGAVSDDYIRQQQRLRDIRSEIRQIERRLAEASAIRGDGVTRADTLLSEARAAGLASVSDDATWEVKLEALKAIQSSPVPKALPEGDESVEYRRLVGERNDLLALQRNLQATLERVRSFEGTSQGYSDEAREHVARLAAGAIFARDEPGDACPLCTQHLGPAHSSPSIADLRDAADYIGERSGALHSATPRIDFAIQEIESKLASARLDLDKNRERLNAVKRSSERLQLATDVEGRRALVLGRISLYVENIPEMSGLSSLQQDLERLKSTERELTEDLSEETIQQRLDSCLSHVNGYLTEYARKIGLEFSDSPLRLDVRALTIIADTPERPIPMSGIGSGENHVGYHIVAHLALHTWFTLRHRPVPSFLILDQLSQAHFSPDAPVAGKTAEGIDADRRAVKKLYGLIFDVVARLKGEFQVIVTDHPDFKDDPRFQDALRERWRDGLKLIPEDWPTAP